MLEYLREEVVSLQYNTQFSNIEAIDMLIRRNIKDLYFNGYEIVDKRNINYGTRFKFSKEDLNLPITMYFSKKKGISIVKDQNIEHPEYYELINILNNWIKGAEKSEENFSKWIGTDEAGKGDYFGPLVVAGFFMDKSIKKIIESLGTKDSKTLSDNDVERIFQHIEYNYLDNFSVRVLMPYEYNRMISNLKKDGNTLNDLLGILHSQVILDLYHRHKGTEGIITDQFTHQDKVHNLIKDSVSADYIQRTKAESDIAVAAASVIARAVFLRQLKIMGEEYKTVFPKGASNQVIDWAVDFCGKHDEKSLFHVAKMHFKTTNNIMDMIRSKKIHEV